LYLLYLITRVVFIVLMVFNWSYCMYCS